jgi:hypothetical protein
VLDWLRRTVSGLWGGITDAVKDFVHTIVGGLMGALGFLFHDVTAKWSELVQAAEELEAGAWMLGRSLWHQLARIVTYDIPHYAMTAWWWVTHQDQLASVLFWWILRYLEERAWTAAQYLGEFFTALALRNLRRFLHLMETILVAVL